MVKVREVIHGAIADMVERGVSLPVGRQRFPYGSRELVKPFAVPAVVPIVALVHVLVVLTLSSNSFWPGRMEATKAVLYNRREAG